MIEGRKFSAFKVNQFSNRLERLKERLSQSNGSIWTIINVCNLLCMFEMVFEEMKIDIEGKIIK